MQGDERDCKIKENMQFCNDSNLFLSMILWKEGRSPSKKQTINLSMYKYLNWVVVKQKLHPQFFNDTANSQAELLKENWNNNDKQYQFCGNNLWKITWVSERDNKEELW